MTDLRKRLGELIARHETYSSPPLASALVAILDACAAAEAEGCATLNIAWIKAAIERAVEDQ